MLLAMAPRLRGIIPATVPLMPTYEPVESPTDQIMWPYDLDCISEQGQASTEPLCSQIQYVGLGQGSALDPQINPIHHPGSGPQIDLTFGILHAN